MRPIQFHQIASRLWAVTGMADPGLRLRYRHLARWRRSRSYAGSSHSWRGVNLPASMHFRWLLPTPLLLQKMRSEHLDLAQDHTPHRPAKRCPTFVRHDASSPCLGRHFGCKNTRFGPHVNHLPNDRRRKLVRQTRDQTHPNADTAASKRRAYLWVTLDGECVNLAVGIPRGQRVDERLVSRRQYLPRALFRKDDDMVGVLSKASKVRVLVRSIIATGLHGARAPSVESPKISVRTAARPRLCTRWCTCRSAKGAD